MTSPRVSRRWARPTEYHLGSSPGRRADGGFEATLVVAPDGAPRVRLTQLGWGDGVGWYAQRTLEFGLTEARQIAALLDLAPAMVEQIADAESSRASLASQAEPIDLAQVRATRPGRRRGRTRRNGGTTSPVPISIASRHGAEATNEAPARSQPAADRR